MMLIVVVSANGCSSTAKYPHAQINSGQKIGVYAVFKDQITANTLGNDFVTLASRNTTADIQEKLSLLPIDKTVMKYFMQSFPARTQAQVVPILDNQIKPENAQADSFDSVVTGRSLSLDYVLVLELKRILKTTGYLYQEKWKPELVVTAKMVRVADGQLVMHETAEASEKPFDKFLGWRALNKSLSASFTNLSLATVNQLADNVGPVVRKVPESERLVHRKIYDFGHIRSMASRDNCVISGKLTMEKRGELVTYLVPCRDITLTYACDNESESSRCWLQ